MEIKEFLNQGISLRKTLGILGLATLILCAFNVIMIAQSTGGTNSSIYLYNGAMNGTSISVSGGVNASWLNGTLAYGNLTGYPNSLPYANLTGTPSTVGTYSYVVSTNGTNFYAKNGFTQQIDYQSTNTSNIFGNLTSNNISVLIRNGTYVINASSWNPGSNIEIDGESWNSVLRIADNAPTNMYACIYVVNQVNVTIKNLQIDGNRANQQGGSVSHGIQVRNSTNVLIEHNCVHDTVYDGIGAWYSSGLVTIFDNTVFNTGQHQCIYTEGYGYDSNCEVIDNRVYNAGLGGVQGTGISANMARNEVVSGNIVYNCTQGIQAYGDNASAISDGVTISENIIYNSTIDYGILVQYANNMLISENQIHDTNSTGIAFAYVNDSSITNNHLWNCSGGVVGGETIYVSSLSCHNLVSENTIDHTLGKTNNHGTGIWIDGTSSWYNSVKNNQIYDDGSPKVTWTGIWINANYTDVENNQITDCSTYSIYFNTATLGDTVKGNSGFITELYASANNATGTTWTFTPAMGNGGGSAPSPTYVFCSFNSTAMSAKGYTWSYGAPTLTITAGGSTSDSTVKCSIYAVYVP